MKKKVLEDVWDSLIILLSVYTVIEFFISLVTKTSSAEEARLDAIDFGVCMLFLADWFYYFIQAKDKKHYTKSHLIDLLASIPYVQILRPFRIFRAVRILRLLRVIPAIRGGGKFVKIFAKNRARSAMTIYLIFTTLIYFYGTLGVYNFEVGINRNVRTFGDAMWMCFTTLTTVGYGDCYPVTPGGRVLCAVLVLTGMGLFSLLTAEFASFILKEVKQFQK